MKTRCIFFILLFIFLAMACSRQTLMERSPFSVQLFQGQNIRFHPDEYNNKHVEINDIGISENGRVVFRHLQLPDITGYKAELTIRLVSAGDPWDKAGSCFIVPYTKKTVINVLKGGEFPKTEDDLLIKLPGIISYEDYVPAVELMRFMTPFGVGYYSDNERYPPPAFVDQWAEYSEWTVDITQILKSVGGNVYIGIWIDTWTKEGYIVDAVLHYRPSCLSPEIKDQHIVPLVNTVLYSTSQGYPDLFSRQCLSVEANIPQNAGNIRLIYTATGHGGHAGGDEFTQKEHIISLDGQKLHSFIPWRNDCASFRRFNPSSGVWLINQEMRHFCRDTGKSVITEVSVPLASSDLSRTNWCPGSSVVPEIIQMDNIRPGRRTINFNIPEAQAIDGDKMNFWLISAYLIYDFK